LAISGAPSAFSATLFQLRNSYNWQQQQD